MADRNWHLWVFLFFILASTVLKYPFWGVLSYGEHHWWSANALNFASNWWDEGYLALKGALYTQAASVEFALPESRSTYPMLSSFFVLPIFWISKTLGLFPAIWMLNALSFILHGIFAYLTGALSYLLLGTYKEKYRRLAFLITAFSVLFSYKLLYLYSAVYWSDQLVMPIVAGILYCELLLKEKSTRLLVCQQVLIFLACLADTYGVIFSLLLFSYHIFSRDKKRSLQVFYPTALAIVLSVFYVSRLGPWELIKGQVLSEFGMRLEKDMTVADLFSGIFFKHLGFYILGFLLSLGFAEYLQRKKMLTSKMLILLFLPPVLYSLICANKSYKIEFSVIKFYLPIYVCLFGLLPAILYSYSDSLAKKKKNEKWLIKFFVVFPALLTIFLLSINYNLLLKNNTKDMDLVNRLQWIKSVSQPEQVIFSNNLTVNFFPPQGNYYLRKPVWRFGGSVGLLTWQRIFYDAVDYPLLWLEKNTKNSPECVELYLRNGAKEVSQYEDLRAFLFKSVKAFGAIPKDRLEKCLKAFK